MGFFLDFWSIILALGLKFLRGPDSEEDGKKKRRRKRKRASTSSNQEASALPDSPAHAWLAQAGQEAVGNLLLMSEIMDGLAEVDGKLKREEAVLRGS